MTVETTVQTLANQFSHLIREWFTDEELREAVERNKTIGPLSCATHDFCDANEAMAEAWEIVFRSEINCEDERQCELWGQAWDLAKDAEFREIK